MVTKGEIQSIDYQGNTCIVRLPYFESAGIKDNIQAEATINNQPGMYNGYKAGDIVWVAFEDGEASQPVVIGKLYLGANKERNDPRGVVNAESSIISNNIQLPITTKIVYETDGTVAQNGITRYNTLSDITNELGKLSGKQSLTTVDMAGLTTTANQIKAEVSSIKSQTGLKADYIQADEPKSPNYVKWAAYTQFTSADQYVGFYINIGTETERKYIEITDENKEVWITNPGVQTAYKEQELNENNTWLYTGDDLYEKEDQPANITDFIGCYVYCNDDKSESLADKDPSETTCPVSSGHHTQEPKCYKADKGYKFVLISSDNKSKITDVENTVAYKIHLAKNTAFRVASIENNKATWEETTLSYIKGFASSITQTDKSIDAKVSKKYNDKTTDFGWLIEQQDDIESAENPDHYKDGDEYGKFVVYSNIQYEDTSKKSPGKTDVLHVNRNGVTITGNLEVEDSNNQKIFRALPYGDFVRNADTSIKTDEEGHALYDGNPQVEIGTQANIGKENSLWLSPTKGSETPVSIARSMEESDWRITSGKAFGVTKTGSLYSNDITIDGINMNAISNNDSDYYTVNVQFDSDTSSFKVTLSGDAVADRSFLVKIYYKLSDSQSDSYFTEVLFKAGNTEAYSTPLIGITASDVSCSWTPQKIALRQGSFLNPSGFFDDREFSHTCGYHMYLSNNNYQLESAITQWYYALNGDSAYIIGGFDMLNETSSFPTGDYWHLSAKNVKVGDLIYITWTQQLYNRFTKKESTVNFYNVFQAVKDTTTQAMYFESYTNVKNAITQFATEIIKQTTSLASLSQKTYRSDTYIANRDKCVLYIPKEDFSSITSACITTEGNWTNIALPISLAICDIDNDSNDSYCLVTVQATALKVSDSTIVPYTIDTDTSTGFSTEGLYANVLCYGVDSFYTSGSILAALQQIDSTNFSTQLKAITEISLQNLPIDDSSYAVTVTLGKSGQQNTIEIAADDAFKEAGSLIELS